MKAEKTSFEQELREHGELIHRGTGKSMWPLLKEGRDLMVIRPKPTGRLKKYDAPLYRRGSRYVLHRIVKVRAEDYVICGDNCIHRERGVTDDQIVGKLAAVIRKGRYIPVSSRGYRLYVRTWCGLYRLRVLVMWLAALSRRVMRK